MLGEIRRIRSIILCKLHSFEIVSYSRNKTILKPGDLLRITGKVRNNGLRKGTVYLIAILADPYYHKNIICSTDWDSDQGKRQSLRLIDIDRGNIIDFCCDIQLPHSLKRGILDLRLELWTPDKLFTEALSKHNAFLFHKTKWRDRVEIVDPGNVVYKVFISYSWFSPQHRDWVRQLSEELLKRKIEVILDQNDIYPGDEIISFMDKGVSKHSICLAICSSSYTAKANAKEGYVWHEVDLLTRQMRSNGELLTVIPVIRDNETKSLPDCFKKIVYIDMDIEDWRAEPLSLLVTAINRKQGLN